MFNPTHYTSVAVKFPPSLQFYFVECFAQKYLYLGFSRQHESLPAKDLRHDDPIYLPQKTRHIDWTEDTHPNFSQANAKVQI